MAITQDRLLLLLQAGEQYQLMFQHIQSRVFDYYNRAKRGDPGLKGEELTLSNVLSDLALDMQGMPDMGAGAILAVERAKYALTHTKNTYLRHRSERRRRSTGAQPMGFRPSQEKGLQEPYDTIAALRAKALLIDAKDDALQGFNQSFTNGAKSSSPLTVLSGPNGPITISRPQHMTDQEYQAFCLEIEKEIPKEGG